MVKNFLQTFFLRIFCVSAKEKSANEKEDFFCDCVKFIDKTLRILNPTLLHVRKAGNTRIAVLRERKCRETCLMFYEKEL